MNYPSPGPSPKRRGEFETVRLVSFTARDVLEAFIRNAALFTRLPSPLRGGAGGGVIWLIAALLFAACTAPAFAAPPAKPAPAPPTPVLAPPPRDMMSDTWAASDALGRVVPMGGGAQKEGANQSVVRSPRTGKRFVGIFYFLWQGSHGTPGPYDLSRLLADNPQNPAYGPPSAFHWWGEPEAGYFRANDPWVIRRNMAMLQNAGVDVLLLDVTNAFTYPETVKVLCDTLRQMRREGNQTPQIAFVTHAHGAETVERLWNEIYKKAAYRELWFRWDGKPLLLADRNVKFASGDGLPPVMLDFFTFRYSWAWDAGQNKWPWIDKYPQHWGWVSDPAVPEEMPVAVASHPTLNIGRSFHDGQQPPLDAQSLTLTANVGLHFAEQWARAIEVDPQFVFVTGWNEWVAQRFVVAPNQKVDFLNKPLNPGDTFFVDAFNGEFNRDLEPSRTGGDALYYQFVANVRKYKGARPVPPSGPAKTIRIDGSFADWANIKPEYRDAKGDTVPRNADGWGDLHYSDTTGRNDIVRAKVAYDRRTVAFFVETAAPLSPRTGPNWMQLFIDADQNPQTGWHGYDFVVNLAPPATNTETTLSRFVGDSKTGTWAWKPAGGVVYQMRGSKMELKIPRALLGLPEGRLAFDFHWADNANAASEGIQAFFLHGDSAPDRRFNYRFDTGPTQK